MPPQTHPPMTPKASVMSRKSVKNILIRKRMKMMVVYRCNNCLWEGDSNDMAAEGDYLVCPNCFASFCPTNVDDNVWSVVRIDEDEDGEDYGEF